MTEDVFSWWGCVAADAPASGRRDGPGGDSAVSEDGDMRGGEGRERGGAVKPRDAAKTLKVGFFHDAEAALSRV